MSEEDINFLISIQDLEQPEFDNACLERENERLRKQLQQKENIIKEVREDLDKQIIFCTNEANGTTNDKICRIIINYLKHLKEILDKEKTRQTATITLAENREYEIRKNWFRIFGKEKRITPKSYYLRLDTEDYEILYDLIKADMVEKVEE